MMFFDNFNANSFKGNAQVYYESELELIMKKIYQCYLKLIAETDRLENDEDKLRDYLHCNYLNNVTIKKEIGLTYHFECEPKEFGTSDGYLDIKVFNSNIFDDPKEYYIIECKRLDNKNRTGVSGLNGKYIKNGILRFVQQKYSCFHRVNGMIGMVVEKMDIAENVFDINVLLNEKCPEAATVATLTKHNGFDSTFASEHLDTANRRFKLLHMMLDFSDKIARAS